MNQKEIRELIELLVEKDITEFELERGDIKVHVKRGGPTAPVVHVAPAVSAVQPLPVAVMPPAPAASVSAPEGGAQPAAPAAPSPSAAVSSDADLYIVKSPIVGTYYEAPSPGTPPFVKVGDTVKEGQVLCIIEAMKLMNEIEAEVSGVIAKMLVSNGSPVEYGMPLFSIRRL
jgi:acetyl-CoA carboxylase biotin carboxyl carrier protein